MTVRIELEPEVEAQLLAEAREKGLSLEAYLAAHARPISAPLSDDAVRPEHVVRDAR